MRPCWSIIPFTSSRAAHKALPLSPRCFISAPLHSRTPWDNLQTRPYSRPPSSEASVDGRARLSRFWMPTGGIAASPDEDSHAKLIRAGFLRQAHSGIFHLLPLGRRVQDKLEALIDKHMFQLGASKLSLSSISSEELWERSGRLGSVGSELFRFQDRKNGRYLLSPTHEEEITSLISSTVTSYKDLPVRVFQTSRKYRDERRPRHGLLRSREFLMKDLYTFDYSPSLALQTYHEVRAAYARLFNELKLPYLVAEADSGDMGGNLSHEFHFPTSKGEDHIVSCASCGYVANEELAETSAHTKPVTTKWDEENLRLWCGISKDRLTLVNVWYPHTDTPKEEASENVVMNEVNTHAVKSILPELDPSVEDAWSIWADQNAQAAQSTGPELSQSKIIDLFDGRIPDHVKSDIIERVSISVSQAISEHPTTQEPLNLLQIKDGDSCPRCPEGTLKVQKAIELGHTFHLGTRYSKPLNASITLPTGYIKTKGVVAIDPTSEKATAASDNSEQVSAYFQMGCHGIGVSRIIGAVADTLADDRGLNWPRVMAPFEVVIVNPKKDHEAAEIVHDALVASEGPRLDVVIDDRQENFSWRMGDADLVGYPVIIVTGRSWLKEQICEVQCRRLGIKEDVALAELPTFVRGLLDQI